MKNFIKRFGFAWKGLKIAAGQQNFRIHLLAALAAVGFGIILHISPAEWCFVVAAIFMVMAMESMNTAVEKLVDFISPGYHEQAGQVKDISAAAVLLAAIGAAVTGLIIFLPKIIQLL
jgi:diacylglycerol kinase (ATP)